MKILDLTDPKVALDWELSQAENFEQLQIAISNTGMKYKQFQEIAISAQKHGYNSIRFKSYRGSGNNLVIFAEDPSFFSKIFTFEKSSPASTYLK